MRDHETVKICSEFVCVGIVEYANPLCNRQFQCCIATLMSFQRFNYGTVSSVTQGAKVVTRLYFDQW